METASAVLARPEPVDSAGADGQPHVRSAERARWGERLSTAPWSAATDPIGSICAALHTSHRLYDYQDLFFFGDPERAPRRMWPTKRARLSPLLASGIRI
jgi:hypothetical protein